ncbi:hypothetical protein K7432_014671 [Basidiobolus ranarum]|uniref:Uncharacterized protein n=1 Tax=Basidiobolus ranarum TaxID=34480 RepID=A0ABR2VP47_9FUNG
MVEEEYQQRAGMRFAAEIDSDSRNTTKDHHAFNKRKKAVRPLQILWTGGLSKTLKK